MKNTLNFGQKGVSGIYQIYNLITNTYYIGSAFNLSKRFSSHKWLLTNNRHWNKKLQNSYNKHGGDNFEFRLLECCSKEIVIQREQYYFDSLKPYYNYNPTAGNCAGRKLTQSHIQRIKEANTGLKRTEEQKKAVGEKNKLQKRTKEQKLNLSLKNKGKILSEKTKQLISKSLKGRKKTHLSHTAKLTKEQVNEIKELLKFTSSKEVAIQFKVSYDSISSIKAGRTWK